MSFKFESYKEADVSLTSEIRQLESICNKYDGTNYSLFLENAYNADKNIDYIYLARNGRELISLLIIFFPDKKEIEVYGFTHPEYRKRGLFSSLIESTRGPLQGMGDYFYLFVCDPACKTGIAFLEHRDTVLKETEYMMVLNEVDFCKYRDSPIIPESLLELKKATVNDIKDISAISSVMYEEEKGNSADLIRETILSDKREQLIGLLHGVIVGICTIGREDDSMMINGLAIDRSHQGRGLGRDLLEQVILYTFKKYRSDIKLEVSSVNEKAFNLYKSVGFKQRESYGYYRSVQS